METGQLGFPFGTGYVFTVASRCVAAANLAAAAGGILPPGRRRQIASVFSDNTPVPPGRMPGSTAGRMPAATVNTYGTGTSISSMRPVSLARAKSFSAWEQFGSSARKKSSNRRNRSRNLVFRDLFLRVTP